MRENEKLSGKKPNQRLMSLIRRFGINYNGGNAETKIGYLFLRGLQNFVIGNERRQ
jgi:hypothetical protein